MYIILQISSTWSMTNKWVAVKPLFKLLLLKLTEQLFRWHNHCMNNYLSNISLQNRKVTFLCILFNRATVRLLTMSNTAVNVFIYAGRHPDFKEFFTKSLNFLCFRSCCQSKRIHDHSQGKLKKINRRDFLTFSQCLLLVI